MARLVAAPPQNGRATGWERERRGRWLMSWSLAGGDGKGGKEGGEVCDLGGRKRQLHRVHGPVEVVSGFQVLGVGWCF